MADNQRNWKEVTVDTDSTIWDREKPLEGKFVKVEHDIGPNKSNMYTLETEDGEVKAWGSTVLDDKLMGIPKGTYVKIEYEGKKTSKNGGSYHSFKLFIDEDSVPQVAPQDEVVSFDDGQPISLDDMPPEFLK